MKINEGIVVTLKGATVSGDDVNAAIEAYTLEKGNLRNAIAIQDAIDCTEGHGMLLAKAIGIAYADVAVRTRVTGAREEFFAFLLDGVRSDDDVKAYCEDKGGAVEKQLSHYSAICDLVRQVREQVAQEAQASAKAAGKTKAGK